MTSTNFQLMANTKGRGVELDGDIGSFWIHHYNSNTPKPDHFSRYLDAYVRIRGFKRFHDRIDGFREVKGVRARYPQSRIGLMLSGPHSQKRLALAHGF